MDAIKLAAARAAGRYGVVTIGGKDGSLLRTRLGDALVGCDRFTPGVYKSCD
jgi:hypothetical protein